MKHSATFSLLCALCVVLSACASSTDFTQGIPDSGAVNNRPAVDIAEP